MARGSIMSQLYALLLENPKISRKEAAEKLGVTRTLIDTYFWRLCDKGIIEVNTDRSVNVLKPIKDVEIQPNYKQEVYKTMVEIYLEDFKVQERFLDRVAVGREIRLLLERM